MRKIAILFAAAFLILGFAGVQKAAAVTFCTVQYVGAESKAHKTAAGAKARAWVNWKGKMRNLYGRNFSLAKARPMSGYPTTAKVSRFNYSARVSAQGCYSGSQLCSSSTTNCLCLSYQEAKAKGCDFYAR